MFFFKSSLDNKRHENDNFNREELIANTTKLFGETLSCRQLKKRAKLWYAADHLIRPDLLDKLSNCPYVEVRESVAANIHTLPQTLEKLLSDEDFQVRETATLNQNLTLEKVRDMLEDKNEKVRKAAEFRLKSE